MTAQAIATPAPEAQKRPWYKHPGLWIAAFFVSLLALNTAFYAVAFSKPSGFMTSDEVRADTEANMKPEAAMPKGAAAQVLTPSMPAP